MIVVNASRIGVTRLCIASNCPDDAEPSGYCRRHQEHLAAGKAVAVHVVEQPTVTDMETHLKCYGKCHQWLPDEAFPRGGRARLKRRDRHSECKACAATRRRLARDSRPCTAATAKGSPCTQYPIAGSDYCRHHTPETTP